MKSLVCRSFAGVTLLTGIMFFAPVNAAENNLKFSGTLVSDPCELDPGTSELTVDFGTVIKKGLYLHQRTNAKPFTINLIECDTAQGNEVTITFSGTESTALPGALAVTGTEGIAIGLENTNGAPQAFNQPTPVYTLASGTNSFTLQAYVAGEPDAIQAQSITTGDFSATATFEMAYP
ncbi:fimbrial protein [Rahnella selenatireducens]|uniref:fimbrial protein n=1 Tax=Rahnella selenatireducens TaxID=3389797 RepID=UPI0039687A03